MKRIIKFKVVKEEIKGVKFIGVIKKKVVFKKEIVVKKVCWLCFRLCGGYIRYNWVNFLIFRLRLLLRRLCLRR